MDIAGRERWRAQCFASVDGPGVPAHPARHAVCGSGRVQAPGTDGHADGQLRTPALSPSQPASLPACQPAPLPHPGLGRATHCHSHTAYTGGSKLATICTVIHSVQSLTGSRQQLGCVAPSLQISNRQTKLFQCAQLYKQVKWGGVLDKMNRQQHKSRFSGVMSWSSLITDPATRCSLSF